LTCQWLGKRLGVRRNEDRRDRDLLLLGLSSSLSEDVVFRDEWIGEAYGIGGVYDPIAFEAMKALFDMCGSGDVPRAARVVFWHTGSLVTLGRIADLEP
jgi:hypothetical protein